MELMDLMIEVERFMLGEKLSHESTIEELLNAMAQAAAEE